MINNKLCSNLGNDALEINELEIKKLLEKHGARKEFYHICDSPTFEIESKVYHIGNILMFIEKFIENYINNTEKEYPTYVYDIKPIDVFDIHTHSIRFAEVTDVYLNKKGILRSIRIKKIEKIIKMKNANSYDMDTDIHKIT